MPPLEPYTGRPTVAVVMVDKVRMAEIRFPLSAQHNLRLKRSEAIGGQWSDASGAIVEENGFGVHHEPLPAAGGTQTFLLLEITPR